MEDLSEGKEAGYYSNHRLSRDRIHACAVLLSVATLRLTSLTGSDVMQRQVGGARVLRTRSACARGAGAGIPGSERVAVVSRSVPWSPPGASAEVGACVPVARVPARGYPGHRGVGVIQCPLSLRCFSAGLTVDPCLRGCPSVAWCDVGNPSFPETTGASPNQGLSVTRFCSRHHLVLT